MKATASPDTEPDFYSMEFCYSNAEEAQAASRVYVEQQVAPAVTMDEGDDVDDNSMMAIEGENPEATPIVSPVSTSERTFKPKALGLDWPGNLVLPFGPDREVDVQNEFDASPPLIRPSSSKAHDKAYYSNKIDASLSRGTPLSLTSILSPSPNSRAAMQRQEEQEVWGLSPEEDGEFLHQGDEVFFEGNKFRFLDIPGNEDDIHPTSTLSGGQQQCYSIQSGETIYSCNYIASV